GDRIARRVDILDHREKGFARKASAAVAVEVQENREEPGAKIAPMEKVLAPERADDRVLHEIVGAFRVAHERPRETSQGRNQWLQAAADGGHRRLQSEAQYSHFDPSPERTRRDARIFLWLDGRKPPCHRTAHKQLFEAETIHGPDGRLNAWQEGPGTGY